MPDFSRRHGYYRLTEAEITIREDAPHELRGILVQLAYDAASSLRKEHREIAGLRQYRAIYCAWISAE